ncbi:RNA-directed DNA polymerase from mobile element jockey [Trichonephila clavipes]|nr:RNA-directed DNA polymerase from mobile element jockey [Trichonephila clavipes]
MEDSMDAGNAKYFRTPMSIKELVLRAGQRKISEINMFLENKQKPSSIPKINPQLLYMEIKSKIPKFDQISNMSFTRNGRAAVAQLLRYITQPQIQANIFADFFASKNAYHEPIPLDFFHKEDNNLNKPFHIFEIHRVSQSKNSTPGADHITASFLKNLDRNGCEIILRYFQDLFDNAIVPNSWKHAVILPIPKQCKDKTRISSYRPIALTSIFSKTSERVLTNRLSYFLTTERKLHPQHYGFVPFKDSRSATYLIHKAIMDAKLKKKYFVGVSLDIKNAYDSVYVDGLLYKCLQIGITGKTAIWIHKFLTYRSFQIKWRGYLSSIRIFPQGLPQGSVLSPILYTIYMYDFFETLENDIECSVYADDVFLYSSHHSLDYICKKMQNTLDRISQWCKYWKLSLSPDKSTISELSNKRITTFPNILLEGHSLPWQSSIKYLGVHFSKRSQNISLRNQLNNKALKKLIALRLWHISIMDQEQQI